MENQTTTGGQSAKNTVYIGKHLESPIYYFASIKDGVVRFLRFGFSPYYPFWVGGVNTGATHCVPDKLSPIPCPKEAWEELNLFLEGKVKYEVVPKKRGRKARVERVVHSQAETGNGSITSVKPELSSTTSGPDVHDGKTKRTRGRRAEGVVPVKRKAGSGQTASSAVAKPEPQKKVRATRQKTKEPVVETVKVQKAKTVRSTKTKAEVTKPKVKQPVVVVETTQKKLQSRTEVGTKNQTLEVPKRGRGRPPGTGKGSKKKVV